MAGEIFWSSKGSENIDGLVQDYSNSYSVYEPKVHIEQSILSRTYKFEYGNDMYQLYGGHVYRPHLCLVLCVVLVTSSLWPSHVM